MLCISGFVVESIACLQSCELDPACLAAHLSLLLLHPPNPIGKQTKYICYHMQPDDWLLMGVSVFGLLLIWLLTAEQVQSLLVKR